MSAVWLLCPFLRCQDAVCWRLWWPEGDGFGLTMGAQVSLGNRRDLTQDIKLPLGFFFFSTRSPLCLPCIPAFMPSQCPPTKGKDGSLVPAENVMKSWDTMVISVLMMWELCSHLDIDYLTPGQRTIPLMVGYNHFPSPPVILPRHTVQIYCLA